MRTVAGPAANHLLRAMVPMIAFSARLILFCRTPVPRDRNDGLVCLLAPLQNTPVCRQHPGKTFRKSGRYRLPEPSYWDVAVMRI